MYTHEAECTELARFAVSSISHSHRAISFKALFQWLSVILVNMPGHPPPQLHTMAISHFYDLIDEVSGRQHENFWKSLSWCCTWFFFYWRKYPCQWQKQMEHVHSRPTGIAVAGHSGALIQGPEPGQVSKLVSSGKSFASFFFFETLLRWN